MLETLRLVALGCCGVVATWPSDARAEDDYYVAEGKKRMQQSVERFNSTYGVRVAIDVDWSAVKDNYTRWGAHCALVLTGIEAVCTRSITEGPFSSCVKQLVGRFDQVTCIASPSSKDNAQVSLDKRTLVYRIKFDNADAEHTARALKSVWSDTLELTATEETQRMQDSYGRRTGQQRPLQIDHDTFRRSKLDPNQIVNACAETWKTLAELVPSGSDNCEDQGWAMCKGDTAKGKAFADRVKSVACKYAPSATTPSLDRAGVLTYYVGPWSRNGLGRTQFMLLRKQLKIRGCAQDLLFLADAEKQACCPKDARGKCMQRQSRTARECGKTVDPDTRKFKTTCGNVTRYYFTDAQRRSAR